MTLQSVALGSNQERFNATCYGNCFLERFFRRPFGFVEGVDFIPALEERGSGLDLDSWCQVEVSVC